MDRMDRFVKKNVVLTVKELIEDEYRAFNDVWNDDYTVSEDYSDMAIFAVLSNAGVSPVSICGSTVVQGAMLITTLRLFVENSIPYNRNLGGQEKVFFRDLSKRLQKEFLKTNIPVALIDRKHESHDELVQYFYLAEYSWYKSKLFRDKVARAIDEIGKKRGVKTC